MQWDNLSLWKPVVLGAGVGDVTGPLNIIQWPHVNTPPLLIAQENVNPKVDGKRHPAGRGGCRQIPHLLLSKPNTSPSDLS